MSDYPEHDKLRKIHDKSQAIGEFIEWAHAEKGLFFAHAKDGRFAAPFTYNIQSLLAEFFDIDQKVIEQEKRAMLDALRALNEEQP